MVTAVNCPQCGKPVPWQDDQKWKPFCSERCKLIDLGDWASENHRIKGNDVPAIDDPDPSEFH
jgi:endogenous inhibitor of DNA gyrase (YacG/DUF329 family)